ncbi:hypothetical protein [Enterococcus termitis]|uniref:Uncharacterized protein n=1 Tax=Enterococcus termitis TaxID=332950 RepID=A0A1E5GVT0_9ENTE|nr:hypothetical protein [Enterococcus termitis]OEG16788.1 hypothetical protein BCR25_04110 [Enterococcus termitis]OJG99497.1 hypothetical protein RV18_GL001565 [Enterococcus termitis]
MKIEALRNLLDELDSDFEVRVSVEEYKEDRIRNGTTVYGSSQLLAGISIRGNILCLQGTRNADLK